MKNVYVTTILLAASIAFIAAGISSDSLVLSAIGGISAGVYNFIINAKNEE